MVGVEEDDHVRSRLCSSQPREAGQTRRSVAPLRLGHDDDSVGAGHVGGRIRRSVIGHDDGVKIRWQRTQHRRQAVLLVEGRNQDGRRGKVSHETRLSTPRVGTRP